MLMQVSMSMHVHEQAATVVPNAYNQKLYLQDLTLIQSKFQTDLGKIQATFAKLNLNLNNTNISASSEVIKLQQTLAQESNALYNI